MTRRQRLKGRAFRKLPFTFAEHVLCLPIGKRASRRPERWSDGFLAVVERRSEFYLGTALGVVRARGLRRRPPGEKGEPGTLDKLVGVPWHRDLRETDRRRR